nr:immunoglobulin light chain junction region [Macaca mulatta]
CMQGLEFALTF